MAFITVIDADEPFRWQPRDDDTGLLSETAFMLRIVPDDVDADIRKRNSPKTWEKKSRQMVRELNTPLYISDVIDYAIVSWTDLKHAITGGDMPCTAKVKALLPEKWKSEILRLCSGKEAGDFLSSIEHEKKASKPI